MARRKKGMGGLQFRGGVWIIDKRIRGRRVCESCGTSDRQEAEEILARRIEEIRQAEIFGVRPKRTWKQAATKYLNEKEKASLAKDAWALQRIDPFIGSLPIDNVHIGTLRPYIEHARRQGLKNRTINMPLEVVRHVLNLAEGEWLDEHGLTWLRTAPKIRLLPRNDAREPYPISWEEQDTLFRELPVHLRRMAYFVVNTGTRDSEVCGLRWQWEYPVPELGTSVFVIPKEHVKNRQDKVLVLNWTAKQVLDEVRCDHPIWVFTYKGAPLTTMNSTAWKAARKRAGLENVRIHDLRHTFGRRLRAAGVSFEDRQDLLGHKSNRITTHYSMPELESLLASVNAICGENSRKSHVSFMLRKNIPLRVVSNRAG